MNSDRKNIFSENEKTSFLAKITNLIYSKLEWILSFIIEFFSFFLECWGVAGDPRSGGSGRHGESLAAKRTFVGQRPRPCERAEQAELWLKLGGLFPLSYLKLGSLSNKS